MARTSSAYLGPCSAAKCDAVRGRAAALNAAFASAAINPVADVHAAMRRRLDRQKAVHHRHQPRVRRAKRQRCADLIPPQRRSRGSRKQRRRG